MTDLHLKIPATLETDAVAAAVEHVCAGQVLQITMKTTLKKYPGCTHWHLKKNKERGVLEVTWWPRPAGKAPSRLWLSVHGNRTADWISGVMPRLKDLLEAQLSDRLDLSS